MRSYLFTVDYIYDLVLQILAEYFVGQFGRFLDTVQLEVVFNSQNRRYKLTGVEFLESRLIYGLGPVLEEVALVLILGKTAEDFTILALLDELNGFFEVGFVRVVLLLGDKFVLGKATLVLFTTFDLIKQFSVKYILAIIYMAQDVPV